MPSDVVISGAGPNGLMLACELSLAGVRPIVLERLPEPTTENRANGLVGQVVRMLDRRGLYQPLAETSEPPRPTPKFVFGALALDLEAIDDNPLYVIAERMNSLPKLVASRTLTSAQWNASVLAEAAPDLAKLKAERDATFLVLASADLVSSLTAAGLVDEYRIRVSPVLVGRGLHLFTEDVPAADLELVESRSFSGGVTSLTYRPRDSDPVRG